MLSEKTMLGAVNFGHEAMGVAIEAILDLRSKVEERKFEWTEGEINRELSELIKGSFETNISESYEILDKLERRDKL